MDKKRNILIRELMDLIDQARDIQSEIDSTFREAYESLQKANIELGIKDYVQEISSSFRLKMESASNMMGTEIPLVQHEEAPRSTRPMLTTTQRESLAQAKFDKVKELTIKLSSWKIPLPSGQQS